VTVRHEGRDVHDEHGIPHLWGDTLTDLAFAQGHESATARTWQVELQRLRGEGRTAALIGPAGLAWDVFARRSRIAAVAQRAYAGLGEETRRFVSSYVDGVNAAFDEGVTAPELVLRGARPGPWEPWTPLAVFLAQHVLFATFPEKLWGRRVIDVLGERGVAVLLAEPQPSSGSNALALAGSRTTSGLPLVTGDPHRGFESPNVYAQVHLSCPGVDVVGFTFPGVPGVQHFAQAGGRSGGVAWAVTNAMADYQDLYDERLERRGDEVCADEVCADEVWAEGPGGWARCEVVHETVDVLGADPVDLEVVLTERGPVVHGSPDEPGPLSLRTPSYVLGELGFDTLLPLLRARTADDVEAAFARWVEPVNNLVVADATGAVRHLVVGRVPERPPSWQPRDSRDPDQAWTGWLDLPRVEPRDGAVVSANDRATDAFDALGHGFAAPHRADRIRELLAARERWDADDVHGVLMDTRQLGGGSLLDAVAALRGLSATGSALQAELGAWDRVMAAGSVTAGRFVAVRQSFVDLVVADPVLAGLRAPTAYSTLYATWLDLPRHVAVALENVLTHGPDLGLDTAALVRQAVETAARVAVQEWGQRHRFDPLSLLAQVGLDDDPVDVTGSPLSGDLDSVRCTGWVPGATSSWRGSVARYVWDLADRDRSRWTVPLGAGAQDSPHGTDQFEAWRSGELLPLSSEAP
jgi:penicillin amidase